MSGCFKGKATWSQLVMTFEADLSNR